MNIASFPWQISKVVLPFSEKSHSWSHFALFELPRVSISLMTHTQTLKHLSFHPEGINKHLDV